MAKRVPTALVPPAGLEQDATGAWISAGEARFRIDGDVRALAGAWLAIELRFVSDADALRPCLVIGRESADLPLPWPLRCLSRGHARFVGFMPEDLEALWIDPLDGPGRFRIEAVTVRTPSDLALAGRALLRAPIAAAAALGWRAAGKRLRARHRLEAILRRPRAANYRQWLAENDAAGAGERAFMEETAAVRPEPPLISVVMPVYDPRPAELEAAIASVRLQIETRWQLCIADDASSDPAIRPILDAAAAADPRIRVAFRSENGNISAASNSALALATGRYVALLDHDDLLPPHALYRVAGELLAHPEADIVYTDEDKVDDRGRRYDPNFKPDWNEEMLLAQNYLNHLTVVRTDILRRIGGFRIGLEGSQDHDLLLRALDHTDHGRIRHIPRILYHWRNYRRSGSFSGQRIDAALAARRRALEDFVERRSIAATVSEGAFGFNRLRRRLPTPAPKVAVIVPTRDAAGLLRTCTAGILGGTDYPDLELLVVDNGSCEPETLALFDALRRDARVRILSSPGPFNFSALNNRAVAATDAPLVAFVNNDIEVIGPDWLAEMVGLVLADRVAAVGAKLLYPDDRIQHAGIILGVGAPGGIGAVAGHAQLGALDGSRGYYGRLGVAQDISAVTAACAVVRRDAFLAAGGFDEADLAVAFNDVDLCLKLGRAGRRILWTPHAALYHHESATRGSDEAPERHARFRREVRTMLERWGPLLRHDPFYNPNFSRASGHFVLKGMTPRRLPEIDPRFRPLPE